MFIIMSRFKIPGTLKRLYGSLNINNIKRGLDYGGKILKLTREIGEVGSRSDIEGVKRLSDRIINNPTFKHLENGVQVSKNLISGYEQNRQGGLLNPIRPSENSEALRIVNEMRHRRQSLI